MKDAPLVSTDCRVRELREGDLADVVRFDDQHSG